MLILDKVKELMKYNKSKEDPFDVEKWRRETPVDYTKAIDILYSVDHPLVVEEAMKKLVSIYKMYIPDTLFKYISFNDDKDLNNKKIETLRQGKLFLSDPKDFNDPFDEKGYFYKPDKLAEIERLKHVNGKIIDDFSKFMRSVSLTANDFNCMPMWAHYANNHNGYCVSYDIKAKENLQLFACMFPVQYTKERIDITDQIFSFAQNTCKLVEENIKKGIQGTIVDDIRIPLLVGFLGNIKHESWSYEKEFRCSVGANHKESEYINATPQAIYVGLNCNEEYRNKLVEIANFYNIPIYEMSYVEESLAFMLEVREIKK